MIDKKQERLIEVEKINSTAFDRMKRAESRDNYYINKKLKKEVLVVDDPEKIKIINDFWDRYSFAYKNNPLTQIAFYNQSGVFDPSYVGFGQQIHSLVRFWNNETFSTFRNKNYTRLLFPFLKHPKCVVSCSYGIYFDDEYNIITKQEAIDKILKILKEKKELILKPALDSGSGQSIVFITANMPEKDINDYIDKMSPHFVCQEIIKNHESYKIGCDSLNTIRLITIYYNNKVNFVGALLRMSNGKKVDNWDAGGIVCKIKSDGKLSDFAISGDGTRYTKHPNGFEFANHELYRIKDVFDTAIKCHKRIPQQKYISWDFCVDDSGDIVFIEMNSPGGSEVAQCLGINSYINKEFAKEIFDNYIYLLKANFDWDYREHADYVILLKYRGLQKDKSKVRIPEQINGKPVKFVARSAFNK